MPTLRQVLELTQQAPKMLLNIEMKGPKNPDVLKTYDIAKACTPVVGLIEEFKIADRTILSSFTRQILDAMIKLSPERQFKILFLKDDDGKQSAEYDVPQGMQGVNVDLHYLQQNVIRETQDSGSQLGVWYSKKRNEETKPVYDLVFGRTGVQVDYFYSDHPLEAMKQRSRIMRLLKGI